MSSIRAAVCSQFGQPLQIETLELRAPGPSEIQVRLSACAICHSDISYADGGWGGDLPAVYGHEAAGAVEAVGDAVNGISVGDHVVVTLIRACGQCAPCRSGHPVTCEYPSNDLETPLSRSDGTPVVQAMNCGAFAEAVVVDQSQVVRLPKDIDLVSASLLACGVITGMGAVINSAELRAGQDVVVIGAGGVGLNAIQGARIAGARRIVAVDMAEEKRQIAMDFGATDFVQANVDTPWRDVKALLGKGADAVFVTVGLGKVYEMAPRYLAQGGKLVMVGMPHVGDGSNYEPGTIAAYSQSMIGSKMGDSVIARDIPWMVDLYEQGRLKLDELVSQRWPLEQINEAITDTKSGSAKRNVIVFDEALL